MIMNMSTATEKLTRFFGLGDSDEMDFETAEKRSQQVPTNTYNNENRRVETPVTAPVKKEAKLPGFSKPKTETPANKTGVSAENERVKATSQPSRGTESHTRQSRLEESMVKKIAILEPRTYTESKEIAKCIFRNEIVIVNFHLVDEAQARRIVDFLTGTVYALDGDIQRLGGELFICTPPNTEIDSATAKSLLQTQFNSY